MPYLDAVINESLRYHPQGAFLDRLCSKTIELPPALPGLKPIVLKPGTNIWFPVASIQHDPKYFENPKRFDPDRFLLKKASTSQSTFLAFGMGPRNCIGNRFALLETKVVLFNLLARCSFKPCSKTCIPMQLNKRNFSASAKGGFWLQMEAR